jgi:hypothetical protein
MSGKYQQPYRMPCEEIADEPSITFGDPFENSVGPEKVDKYTNTTEVDNWDTPPPATIPPYEMFHDNSGGGACESNGCDPGTTPCGTGWAEPVPANTWSHTPGDKVDFAVAHKRGWKAVQAARSWHGALPWTAPEAGCKTVLCDDGVSGYQEYQSSPSQLKYLTVTYDVHLRNHFDAGEDAGGYWNADKTGARTVNAQSGQITSTLTTSEERAANFGSGAAIIRHVDAGAGYTDVDGDGIHESDFDSGGTTILDDLDNDLHCSFPRFRADADFDLPGFISAWNGAHVTPMPLMTDPNSYSCSITSSDPDGPWTVAATFSRSATVVSWHFTVHQNDPGDGEDNTFEYYGTITLSSANHGDDVLADIKNNLLSTWPLNDDHLYPWRTDRLGSLAPYVTRLEMANTSPIGFNPVQVDDPSSPGTLIDWYDDRVYASDGHTLIYDGSILGAPKPAGYQNAFDFRFTDIRGCCNHPSLGENQWDWYPYGYGMFVDDFNALAGTQLPRNATQWNNYFMAANKPAGAWIVYADHADYFPGDCINSDTDAHSGAGDTAKIVACKYAEILEQWQSQNFAMPAGDAKFWYDETKVACATNVSGSGEGSVWALIDPATGVAPLWPSADQIVGGPVVDGFYEIGSWDGTNVTLGAKAFDLPSNWASKSNGDDATCFGVLRWSDKPSLLGRVAITTASTTATFATAQPAFGMNSSTHQEQVDLYDASMTAVATNVTATRVDDTHFTTAAAYATAVWAQIHGSPKYYVDDSDFKGDYTVLQWWFDYRPAGEQAAARKQCDGTTDIDYPATITYTNADCNAHDLTVDFPSHGYAKFCQQMCCLPFQPCAPRVVCISPNGETWSNGKTIAMPTTLVWDEQYGTRYQGVVDSTMTDLFWQAPHYPCNLDHTCDTWKEDDGSCHANQTSEGDPCDGNECPDTPCTLYYAQRPLVEARLTVPSTDDTCSHAYGPDQDEAGPALPDGIQIGWLSPVDTDPGTEGVALPPKAPGPTSATGKPGDCSFTWDLHKTLCDAHDDDCRFGYNPPGC